MDWQRVAHEFVRDGSLRDIYIFGTDAGDWQRVLDYLVTSGTELAYEEDGQLASLPRRVETIFARREEAATALRVDAGGIAMVCHFFTPEEIEFDFWPEEVQGQGRLDAVLAFMRRLTAITGKPAIMTPENDERSPILLVGPGGDVTYLPAAGS